VPLRRRRCTSGSCLVMCKERRKPTSLAQSDTHSDTQGKDWHSQHDSRNLRAAWIPMWTSTFIWMQQGSSKKSCHITFDVFLVEISWISRHVNSSRQGMTKLPDYVSCWCLRMDFLLCHCYCALTCSNLLIGSWTRNQHDDITRHRYSCHSV
jgi:hypothetical protein